MIPSIISGQVKTGIQDFLRTTFPSRDKVFGPMVDNFLRDEEQLFKGPYVSIKLPFRGGDVNEKHFPDIPLGFTPYLHQQKSFRKLSKGNEKSTIVATGTGSGKTECFLYPILDYCYHHRGEAGIKAIIIYPMNALANDQAKRFAETIASYDHLNGNLNVGLYIGGDDKKTAVMTKDQVITDKNVLKDNPPDILLTNYKMLDLLMVREKDSVIWKHNNTETLKYIVVDELHTFDGAQGTDLACLIRRLKYRLATPENYLCCVGTSATIGGPEDADSLRAYASSMFQEEFDSGSVILEEIVSGVEFLQDHEIDRDSTLFINDILQLDSSLYSTPESFIEAQCKVWFDNKLNLSNINSLEFKQQLARALLSHDIFQQFILAIDGVICTESELEAIIGRIVHDFNIEADYISQLTVSLVSLIAWARKPGIERARPFLDIRYQLWLKEMSRLVATVSIDPSPELKFNDDIGQDEEFKTLPVVYCNECHATGWGTTKSDSESIFESSIDKFYERYFSFSKTTHVLYPVEDQIAYQDKMITVCKDCLCIEALNGSTCESCGSENLIKVFNYNSRKETKNNKTIGSHDCPFCNANNSLTIAGRRSSSLISVALSSLYASTYNDDKKVLTFSDSVQDAAHRAGFFEARTWRFNFRMALKQFLDNYQGEKLSLSNISSKFIHWWKGDNIENFIGTFIPPDMEWLQSYQDFKEKGDRCDNRELLELIERRIDWEITSEFGYNAPIGRTLVKTLSATAELNYNKIDDVVIETIETLRNSIGDLSLQSRDIKNFIVGLLTHIKYRGGIDHPALGIYLNKSCSGYAFSHIGENFKFMPNKSQSSRLPEFVKLAGKSTGNLHPMISSSSNNPRNWFESWMEKCFLNNTSNIEVYKDEFFKTLTEKLVESDLLIFKYGNDNEEILAINPEYLSIGSDVIQYRCNTCSHPIQISKAISNNWDDIPCLQKGCHGSYSIEDQESNYYRKLYSNGDVSRIFSAEHTGLLSRKGREELEASFINRTRAVDPNLLSCTPTLEMGINIGDLSSAVLCSVPPNQANYLQRIGRAGRKDGNSFLLTVAAGSPHDQYFYLEPKEMLSGRVPAPHIYLNAPAVLERQFVAFCFDNWVKDKDPNIVIPTKMFMVFKEFDSPERIGFPYNLFSYIDLNRTELLNSFILLFDGELEFSAKVYIENFVLGDNKEIPSIEDKIKSNIDIFRKEQEGLKKRYRDIKSKVREMDSSTVRDNNFDEEYANLKSEAYALLSFIRTNDRKQLYNFLTDDGLLPNYAFPEAGVILKSVVLSKNSKTDNPSNYITRTFEYERSAKSAIRELAPENYFYAEGRKVKIDQIDLTASEMERWHICDRCSYSIPEAKMEDTQNCPRCNSQMWSDNARTRTMVKLSQVYATTMDKESRISDDSDSRTPVFYNQHVLFDTSEEFITQSWQIENDEVPFGFDYISQASFREINFGPVRNTDETLNVDGKEIEANGFKICKECGKVLDENSETNHSKRNLRHSITCSYRNRADDRDAFVNSVFLYRDYVSEAIRILLPVQDLDEECSIESLIAAIFLGLKMKFGNVNHISSTLISEPTEEENVRRIYLALYDTVPGGTGYLKQLMTEPKEMLEVLKLSLEALRSCECNETEKDGCYRCLLVYRQSRKMNLISRDGAIHLLSKLVKPENNIKKVDSLRNITFNKLFDSELEQKFIESLRASKTIIGGDHIDLKKYTNTPGGNPGWYITVGENHYIIEPQVNIGQRSGSPHPSKPDFVIYPKKNSISSDLIKPIAVFTDGYKYHKDLIHEDMAKRMSIVQNDKHYIWSITWNDLERNKDRKLKYYTSFNNLQRVMASYDVDNPHFVDKDNSFNVLLLLLEKYNVEWFRRYIFGLSLSMLGLPKMKDFDVLKRSWDNNTLNEIFDNNTGENCCGFHNSNTVEDTVNLNHFIYLDWLDYQERNYESLYSYILYNDNCSFSSKENEINSWNSFLYLYNLYQFLPYTKCLTQKGLDESIFDDIHFSAYDIEVEINQDIKDIMELTDHEFDEILLKLKDFSIPEAYYELCNTRGYCIGQADLAWVDMKYAIVDDEEDIKIWEEYGWSIFTIDEIDNLILNLNGERV